MSKREMCVCDSMPEKETERDLKKKSMMREAHASMERMTSGTHLLIESSPSEAKPYMQTV
jgi:hypothetical protein